MSKTIVNPAQELGQLITQVRVNLLNHDVVKAIVSFKFADALFLTGMKVIHGKNGRFVSMPANKDAQGEYHDIFFPSSKEVRDQLQQLVLDEYDKALSSAR